ncbi:MAG TPA: hypothetical protein VFK05_06410 [Polyangiaceae bacterium]|nr:hypothetical protein [Polyangiaceae bacterium]
MSRWLARNWIGWALSCLGLLVACGRADRPDVRRVSEAPNAEAAAVAPAPVEQESPENLACAETLRRLEAAPALPGSAVNSGFARAHLLGRARAEPIAFSRAPHFDAQGSPRARALREELAANEHPAFALEQVLGKVKKSPELAREVFLTEGYLYSERPELAALYVNFLALGLLFREPELRLVRGNEVWKLRHRGTDYEYVDGPLRGQPARLWLFDRVFVAGKEPGPALHVDLRAAAAQSLSDEIRLERLTETGAVVSLRFGSDWLPAALDRSGNALQLNCMRVPPALREVTSRARDLARRRARVTEVLARVVKNEIDEALPFDEPKTEEGQQDGQLRPAWRRAYLDGRERFTFNDDEYWVFDSRGRPRVPQVCIDFVTDTLERASGARFRPRGERREFVRGGLDFDAFGLDNRRSVEIFIGFARAHPEWFEFSETPLAERVPFRERTAFFRDVYEHRDEYRPFDIVTVFGLRSDEKLHHHSFFVVDRDPVTGMPIAVAANAGRPRIRSWENELQNAPRRSILTHIRPKLPWLEALVAPNAELSTQGSAPESGSAG